MWCDIHDIGEIGVAGTKVVDGYLRTSIFDELQKLTDFFYLVHVFALDQFENDSLRLFAQKQLLFDKVLGRFVEDIFCFKIDRKCSGALLQCPECLRDHRTGDMVIELRLFGDIEEVVWGEQLITVFHAYESFILDDRTFAIEDRLIAGYKAVCFHSVFDFFDRGKTLLMQTFVVILRIEDRDVLLHFFRFDKSDIGKFKGMFHMKGNSTVE